ncbi:MAG: PEP-CTERM sorting domain-containing protein [Spirulina sp. SIO3F2]|nr:PEP-CTERM sorting domain-containing protein [Spirulina sp. SIO3F2]
MLISNRPTSHHQPLATVLGATALTLSLANLAPAAQAITLNSTTGTWSNPDGGAFIEYQTVNQENQIRWGFPAYWVETGGKSGLGFLGTGTTEMEVGEVFNLGRLRHYNKTIWYGAPGQVDLSLNLDFEGVGVKSFNYALDIEETPNQEGTCAYFSVTACADRITWTNAIASESFFLDEIEYTLELIGFSASVGGALVDEFISQEGGNSDAFLYAKLTALNPPASQSPQTEAVPEPGSMLAMLGALGGGIWLKRKKRA